MELALSRHTKSCQKLWKNLFFSLPEMISMVAWQHSSVSLLEENPKLQL